MPFCNKCGAPLSPGTGFCGQCGSRNVATVAPPGPETPPPAQRQSRGLGLGAKIALGIGIAIVALVVVMVAAGTFLASHIRTIHTADGRTRVEMPFGTFSQGQPSDVVATQLGVPIYPGAVAERSKVADVSAFGVQAAVLAFHSQDTPRQVLTFYRSQFPQATIGSRDDQELAITAGGLRMNIAAHRHGGQTEIVISRVRR